mgnify:FL=1
MEIIETKIYTKYITELLTDDQYKELQQYLIEFPKGGDVIKGSGGLRKLRWESKNKGKSAGIRNIYYYYESEGTIYMLYVYQKGRQDNLSAKEVALLKSVLEGII